MEFIRTPTYQKAFQDYLRRGGAIDTHHQHAVQATLDEKCRELAVLAKTLIEARIKDLQKQAAVHGHTLRSVPPLDSSALEHAFVQRCISFKALKGAPENERRLAEIFLRDWFAQKIDPVAQPYYGVASFQWVMHSRYPCSTCASYSGQILRWDEGIYPPGCSHCKCTAEPVFDDDVNVAEGGEEPTERELLSISWRLGKHKGDIAWTNRIKEGNWTKERITETIRDGLPYSTENKINRLNGATRYELNDSFVVVDDVTKEILQVSRPRFAKL